MKLLMSLIVLALLSFTPVRSQISDLKVDKKIKLINKIIANPSRLNQIMKSSGFYIMDEVLVINGFLDDKKFFYDYISNFKDSCNLYLYYPFEYTNNGADIYTDAVVIRYNGKNKQKVFNPFITFSFKLFNNKWCLTSIGLGTGLYIGSSPEDIFPPQKQGVKE